MHLDHAPHGDIMNSLAIKNSVANAISQIKDVGLLQVLKTRPLEISELQSYLANIYYILLQTQPCLQLAVGAANLQGAEDLGQYYHDKIEEEQGHHKWCEEDLKKLLGDHYRWSEVEVLDSTRALMNFQKKSIVRRPLVYLGYMTLAEQMTVELGPAVIASLKRRSTENQTEVSVSCISNHIELDKEHVSDDYLMMEKFIQSREDEIEIVEHVIQSTEFIKAFFTEVIEHARSKNRNELPNPYAPSANQLADH